MILGNVVVLLLLVVTSCGQDYQIPIHNVIHHLPQSARSSLLKNLSFSPVSRKDQLNGDSPCLIKLKNLEAGLVTMNRESIACSYYRKILAVFDAAGKPGPGVTEGNLLMLGGYDMCHTIRNASKGYYNFCYVAVPVTLFGYPARIRWTGCLPYECTQGNNTDVESWINSLIPFGVVKLGPGVMDCETDVKFDTGAIVGSVCLGIIALMVVIGTVWVACSPVIRSLFSPSSEDQEYLVKCEDEHQNIQSSSEISPDKIPEQQSEARGGPNSSPKTVEYGWDRFWRCFALQNSFSSLTNAEVKPGQVLCLNGIRVLSINWVVLGHTYLSFYILLGDPTYLGTLLNRRSIAFIMNGNPSVDSFFALSGFLVGYLLLKQLGKQGGMLKAWQWVAYYVHRYLRLTGPYLVVVLVEGFLYRQWVSGPFTFAMESDNKACRDYWWANLLYINNLVPWKATEVCMGQSWYLSNDMQFYILAPLFVVILFWKPMLGLLVNILVIASSALATALITYHYKLGPSTAADLNPDAFWLLYNKPWIRIRAYLIGILGGWLYWRYGQALQERVRRLAEWKKWVIAVPLWTVTCAMQYAIVFGLYDDIKKARIEIKQPSMLDSIAYGSLDRITWPLALIIQILLCQSGLGGFINSILSWSGWLVLGRLTYGVYLVHLGLMKILAVMLRHPFYFNPDFELGVWYSGLLTISYVVAALLNVCVEQPLASLETLSYRKKTTSSDANDR